MEANQQLHAYTVLQQHTKIISFEPHLHAPGARMCLEAIWGYNIQTLNCVGYDHNWVRGYDYTDDSAPLLPKGTILHIIGYMDNSPTNKNVPDPRNWQGSGNRSVANMFIDLGHPRRAQRRAVPGGDGQAAREPEAHEERRRDRMPAVPGDAAGPEDDRSSAAVKHGSTVLLALVCFAAAPAAQSLTYSKGQNVAPGYEGWEQGADGAKYFLFG